MNNKKTHYYDLSIATIEEIKKQNVRPTLGIHVCCGPCMAFPLEFLSEYFKVVILYSNSNIYPSEEYYRRLEELKRYVEDFNKKNNGDTEIIEFKYDNIEYTKCLAPLKDEPECGKRCLLCYEMRMDQTYKYADENNFDYFTTVMTISRQKSSIVMNEIGEKLSKKYKTKYFYSDFKKKKGAERGQEIVKEYNMYSQQYCGCVYSYNDYLKRINK